MSNMFGIKLVVLSALDHHIAQHRPSTCAVMCLPYRQGNGIDYVSSFPPADNA